MTDGHSFNGEIVVKKCKFVKRAQGGLS